MSARAVLFDLDDTLTPRRECVERFAELFAGDWRDELATRSPDKLREALVAADQGGYNPRRAADLLELLAWRDAPDTDELEEHWQTKFPLACVTRPGVHELLARLRDTGSKLGCVTNGGVSGQSAKLDHLDLTRYFDAIVISAAVGCQKPDAQIFALALERLGVDPAEAWFIGDHPRNDVQGASRFGMQAVWLRGTHAWPEGEEPPRHAIDGFHELAELLSVGAGRGG